MTVGPEASTRLGSGGATTSLPDDRHWTLAAHVGLARHEKHARHEGHAGRDPERVLTVARPDASRSDRPPKGRRRRHDHPGTCDRRRRRPQRERLDTRRRPRTPARAAAQDHPAAPHLLHDLHELLRSGLLLGPVADGRILTRTGGCPRGEPTGTARRRHHRRSVRRGPLLLRVPWRRPASGGPLHRHAVRVRSARRGQGREDGGSEPSEGAGGSGAPRTGRPCERRSSWLRFRRRRARSKPRVLRPDT